MLTSIPGILNSEKSSSTVLIPGDGVTAWNTVGSMVTSVGTIYCNSAPSTFVQGGSFGTVPPSTDFELSCDINTTTGGHINNANAYIGVSQTDPDGGFSSIDFSFQLYWGPIADTRIFTSESGVRIGTSRSSFSIGGTLIIKRIGSTIKYYYNTTLLYTSLVPSSSSLLFDSSWARVGFKFENISITY